MEINQIYNFSLQNKTQQTFMSSNWLKPNQYIIQNGKLVPRPSSPEQKAKNYRYIPYDPLNNPTPEDYFRETISRLQKENVALRNQLSQRIDDEAGNVLINNYNSGSVDIYQYQKQIAVLKQEVIKREEQLWDKNHQLMNKDKQLVELSNQNVRLHIRIKNVMKQIQTLNQLMVKKDQEILNKKQQIEEYCQVLDKLTAKEKEEQKTAFSENHMMTPKIQEKGYESDQLRSSQSYSQQDGHSIDKRYMTPEIQIKFNDNRQYIYRSEKQPDDNNFRSGRNSKIQQGKKSNLRSWNAEYVEPNGGNFSSVLPKKR